MGTICSVLEQGKKLCYLLSFQNQKLMDSKTQLCVICCYEFSYLTGPSWEHFFFHLLKRMVKVAWLQSLETEEFCSFANLELIHSLYNSCDPQIF
jgi:hypothetical protein